MGTNTKIEWCDHTFNPWLGCSKLSPACQHCYAEAWAKRTGIVKWGDGAERRKTTESYWRQPLKWNAEAARSGERRRVFCASLADVFEDREELMPWRKELMALIRKTPYLDWLLLTKRPENVNTLMREAMPIGSQQYERKHIQIGTTLESQDQARRVDRLVNCRQWASVLFLSCEPLLGPLDLSPWLKAQDGFAGGQYNMGIDWVIAGGESGGHARPSHPQWFRDLRDQCVAAGVPFHFKQWGEWRSFEGRVVDAGGGFLPSGEFAHNPALVDGFPKTYSTPTDVQWMQRVGKKAAGRLLDGREWNEFPTAA